MARYRITYPDGYTRSEQMGRVAAFFLRLKLGPSYKVQRRKPVRIVKRADFSK